MADYSWTEIEKIIDEALELPEDEREEFIEKRCTGNKKLAEEVRQLLSSITDSEGWLEDPQDYKEGLFEEASDDLSSLPNSHNLIGNKIGSYIIKEKIGEGGMGSVFRAERDDEDFTHVVALKIIQKHRASEENVQRFKKEQQILARLNHPGIAQFYDGGVTDGGIPFIIMEYVNGIPITEYCQKMNCSINQKIELFKKILEAVQYAHENLTIHRDLKPDNILVDQNGNIKILDFGISKLLDEEDFGLTRTDAQVLTLRYASPEQIKGGNITTASDFYSLGIILYKLLTDQEPFDLDDLTRYQVEKVIVEDDPELPSSVVGVNLRKELKGDLDAIIMKSIRKEPESRYRAASEFLSDLDYYFTGLPVSAREGSFQYRSKKFIRRHRQGIGIAAGIVLLVTALVGFYTWRITQEKNLAQLEAEKSEEITSFVINLLEENYPENSQGDTVTVRQILDKSTTEIPMLDKSSEIQAKLLQVIGHAYNSVGEPKKARPLLARSISILDSLNVSNTELAHTYNVAGIIYRDLGKLDSAEIQLRNAVEMFQELDKRTLPEYPKALKNLAYVLRVQSENEEASKLIEEALEIEHQIYEAPDVNIAESIYILASINRYLGKYEAALEYQQESLEMIKAITEGPHPGIVANLSNIAVLHQILGDTLASKTNFLQAMEMAETLFGYEHREVANLSSSLSNIYVREGKFDSAKIYIERSLDITRKTSGTDNPLYGHFINAYGEFYFEQDKFSKADSMHLEALKVFQNNLSPNHPTIALTIRNRADIAIKEENLEKARLLLEESLSMLNSNYENTHPEVQKGTKLLQNVYRNLDEMGKADSLGQHIIVP
jgi:serine/threonine-protein kinase